MVDQNSDLSNDVTKLRVWANYLDERVGNYGWLQNHKADGVNALYIDGHVEWVANTALIERTPGRSAATGATVYADGTAPGDGTYTIRNAACES
ncbi:MAG: hypothetical protein NTY10_00480, partial [Candidatus Omnitrophica bacterium]|nr:hypothetical protein [Candidatus Omnitrophota bacterium]